MSVQETMTLSNKEERLRNYILKNNILLVTLKIGIPVALYQGLNQLFKVFDSLIASQIDSTAASMVSYFSQLNFILQGLGLGLAAGASLKISQAYGEGNYPLVQKRISTLVAFTVLTGLAVSIIIVPLVTPFLKITNTPAEFISIGREYFLIEFFSTIIGFFNSIYIAIERAKGYSKRILFINGGAVMVKFTFTLFSIYILHKGVAFIALSTLLSQILIAGCGIVHLRHKNEVFSFSLKSVSFRDSILLPMLMISIPIMIEKSAFHLGKSIVNSMITVYGPLTVGGLGISNLLCGITTTPLNGFQDTAASVISQNLGAANAKRTLDTFKSMLLVTLVLSTICFIPSYLLASQITGVFAPSDPLFHNTLLSIYRFDVWSIFPLAINASVMALLYGFGYTKLTLVINFCRIFLFRIPVLLWLQRFTNMGSESAGVIMIVSNLLVSLLSIIIAIIFIYHICKKFEISFLEKDE